jgi:hypothetical protein
MPVSRPEPTRGQLRVWLKWALQSGLLEKLPERCDLEGPHDSRTPRDVAHALLAALQDPESSRQDRADAMAEAQRFQAWVDRRLKANRQLLLAERASEHADRGWLERWARAEEMRQHQEREERSAAPAAAPPVKPRWDSMWDAELDGGVA